MVTWNIRSIKDTVKELVGAIEKYGIEFLGKTERRKKAKKRKPLTELLSGVDNGERARGRVKVIVKEQWRRKKYK